MATRSGRGSFCGVMGGAMACVCFIVGQEAFNVADGYRLFNIGAAAFGFTGMMAHPAAYAGQRVGLAHDCQGLVKAFCGSEGEICLRVDAQRTGNPAGAHAALVQHQGARRALGRAARDRRPVGIIQRAELRAFAAPGAQIIINIACVLRTLRP